MIQNDIFHYIFQIVHRKLISLEIATQIMGNIQSILQSMQIISYNLEIQEPILEFASQNDATFYDSAYLFTTLIEKFLLVTDNEKMQKIAKIHNPAHIYRIWCIMLDERGTDKIA